MNRHEFVRRFPNATEATIRRNSERAAETDREAPHPKPQPPVRHEPVAKAQREASYTEKYLVRIESRRLRLLDPDNLCAKYFLDSLRYSGLIPDDAPQFIELFLTQRKASTQEEECTAIEIIPLGQL